MAQPPGRATSALENLASNGPKTKVEALIVFTSSYLAFKSLIVDASTSTIPVSERVISSPIEPKSSIIVVTSFK